MTLLAIPFRIGSQHFVEIILVALCLIFYKRLKRRSLGKLLLFSVSLLVFDLIAWNILRSAGVYVNVIHSIELIFVVAAIVWYFDLRRHRIDILLFIVFWDFTTVIADNYAERGRYDILLVNVYHLVLPILVYGLFWRLLKPLKYWKTLFFCICLASVSFFVYDYATTGINVTTYATAFIFYGQLAVMVLILLARSAFDELELRRLTDTPYFWVSAGFLIISFAHIVYYAIKIDFINKDWSIFYQDAVFFLLPIAKLLWILLAFVAICMARCRIVLSDEAKRSAGFVPSDVVTSVVHQIRSRYAHILGLAVFRKVR